MICKIVLASLLVHQTLGIDTYGEVKRQNMIPSPRFGRAGYWTFVEEKKQTGGMMPYPRLGRQLQLYEILPQTIIPYPRAGRQLIGPEDLYDYEFVADSPPTLEDVLADVVIENGPVMKKRAIGFTPRIGRKKRSIDDEDQSQDEIASNKKRSQTSSDLQDDNDQAWIDLDEPELDRQFFFRPDRQLSGRSRNSFVPRVGKKRAGTYYPGYGGKRKVAFTPRIGRAALIPRIGRSDPLINVKSRGAFIPRIGRRAALIPRVGRSDSTKSRGNSE